MWGRNDVMGNEWDRIERSLSGISCTHTQRGLLPRSRRIHNPDKPACTTASYRSGRDPSGYAHTPRCPGYSISHTRRSESAVGQFWHSASFGSSWSRHRAGPLAIFHQNISVLAVCRCQSWSDARVPSSPCDIQAVCSFPLHSFFSPFLP